MNLDNIISFILTRFDIFDEEKPGEIYIHKKFIKNDKSKVLKIILPPRGGGRIFITSILMQRLYKKGYSSVAYFFPGIVLSSDVDETLKNFNYIKEEIKADILKFKKENSFDRIDVIAPSLGVVSACLIANGNEDISNLFFIVPGSCLASSLWNGIRTKRLKEIYKKKKINEEQLKKIWQELAPKNNIQKMNNKNIFIAISKADKIIPYCFGQELATIVQNLNPNHTTVQSNNYLGHYFTVMKYYLFSKELLK